MRPLPKGIEMNLDTLKRKFETDPLTTVAVGALAVTAAAKLLSAVSEAQGRRAYARYSKANTRYPKS